MRRLTLAGTLAAVVLAAATIASAAEPWAAVVSPQNSLQLAFMKDDAAVLRLSLGGWGPKWAWVGLSAKEKATGDRLVVTALTVTLPADVALLAKQEDLDRLTKTPAGPDWFAFSPTSDLGPAVISMNDWLEKPAGKHGGVRTVGDRFQFEDAAPVKFWGTNLSYGGGCAPQKKDAEFTAARFAKYGVSGVRLHKFSYPKNKMGIGDLDDATKMTPDGLDRLDYFASQLKANGVYFGWSHTYLGTEQPFGIQAWAALRL